MLTTFKRAMGDFPRQYWLMFWGMLISTIGGSMIWPFLMIYVSGKTQQSLTVCASLMTLSSAMGLLSSFIAGPIVDRVGRKGIMVGSLALNALGYTLMSQAETLPAFALVMALNGTVNPLYRVAADAMLTDLIPPEKRIDAYSMMRMSNNVGVALGPLLGGILVTVSYNIAFIGAAIGLLSYGLLIGFFGRETKPEHKTPGTAAPKERFGGYGEIFKDRQFMWFVLDFTAIQICAALIWVLLGVYAKTNYQVPESLYSFIPTTNAVMVVTLQYFVTRFTKRFPPLLMLALGAFFYAGATLTIAFGRDFWAFWVSMVIMTIGELILMPTSSTYVANLAPADKRGRYMSLYSLSWGVASGTGPVLGGLASESLGPQATWFGGSAVGFIGVIGYLLLHRIYRAPRPAQLEAPKEPAASAE
ncbi:MAG TPA: MFS transporter [Anaerolineaceae bacterium]|nr:MFS transporter [Anaerolineaceae bacterium]HPN50358.1 MFS transporter [Anaerolineaceae bacterium]